MRSEYPDLEATLARQTAGITQISMEKEVTLDGKTERQMLVLDTVSWKKELSFLKEINPSLPEYVGAFKKSSADQTTHLVLKEGEKGSLKAFSYKKENNTLKIRATIHEDKDVYVHHREVVANFREGLLENYSIEGYQKIMLKDTMDFKITAKVLPSS